MSQRVRRIEPLPSEVVEKLKSSTSITHLNDVIVELVKNALDANANTVYVTADFKRGGCIVDDDGDGIPPTEFESNGGLGKSYHTSKLFSERDVYGRRGSFLASLSSLSLLTITSQHVHYSSTSTVIFHHSTPVARLIPAPAPGLRFRNHGTSVTVNDLFGNMPVRVKNRALALQKLDRQWDELRQLLVSLILANNSLAKLVVYDASRDRKLIIRPRTGGKRTDGELDLQRVGSILAQAGLIEPRTIDCWNAVSACVPDLSIHAAISLVPSPTKKVQFISVGIDPVFPRNCTNFFFGEINRLFSLSDFGTIGAVPVPTHETSSVEPPGDYNTKMKSAAKTVNKWPMFYVRIDTNAPQKFRGEGQGVPESDKSVQHILDVLSAMINEFLKQHGLLPRAAKRKRKGTHVQEDPGEGSKSTVAPHCLNTAIGTEEALNIKLPDFSKFPRGIGRDLGSWSRVKSAKESNNTDFTDRSQGNYAGLPLGTVNVEPVTKRPTQKSPLSISKVAAESSSGVQQQVDIDAASPRFGNMDTLGTDKVVPWTDPHTGRSHLVNSRTGQSVNVEPSLTAALMDQRPQSTGCLQSVRIRENSEQPRSAMSVRTQNTWAENLLDRWENPALRRPEQPIHAIATGRESVADSLEARVRDSLGGLCGFNTLGLSKFGGKLHKQDLERAEVVSQVDQKFILAKLRPTPAHKAGRDSGATLVLVDQHAADERCRIEGLFEELFSSSKGDSRPIQTVSLERMVFEIPPTEKSLFVENTEYFGSWGFDYTVEQKAGEQSAFIFVHTIPVLIAERCRIEPDLVIEVIRTEIWKREETGRLLGKTDEGQGWVGRLKGCPQGLVDLLNSRACRTAIMFNDKLTIDECQKLVQRLARCVFPFQCAHGRPSMIPLLVMAHELDGDGDGEVLDGRGFLEAFKSWY
ncbi:hypothetical protein EYZ11_007431 [Aspergillus tanneri]|uniref:DNA mismatch repair protein n=1 Tax=Aspergillus tanneri TaxID=1220188 RepID=A0A4S3JD09_9EURO|nr:DNA mismatch repair protein [Aspergillus tanneri]KAA8649178.1 DNA mismatch repair protein [Aspergillus tanneri]THC93093.1 hypothetical protein EYZ11_007431 [Aspergillus tanneri]